MESRIRIGIKLSITPPLVITLCFQDVEVWCEDGVERLPRLLLASLSPTLAACLSETEEPVVILPHNTATQIRYKGNP